MSRQRFHSFQFLIPYQQIKWHQPQTKLPTNIAKLDYSQKTKHSLWIYINHNCLYLWWIITAKLLVRSWWKWHHLIALWVLSNVQHGWNNRNYVCGRTSRDTGSVTKGWRIVWLQIRRGAQTGNQHKFISILTIYIFILLVLMTSWILFNNTSFTAWTYSEQNQRLLLFNGGR